MLLGFGGVWADVKMLLRLWVRCAADCVVGGSFWASPRLGRRISDCVVASGWDVCGWITGMQNASCGHTVLINSLTLLKVTTRKRPDAAILSLRITKTK